MIRLPIIHQSQTILYPTLKLISPTLVLGLIPFVWAF